MRFILLFLLCINLVLIAPCQKQKNPGYTSLFPEEVKFSASKNPAPLSIPFRSLTVIDQRNDTVISGFCKVERYGLVKDGYFIFKDGTSREIEKYLNRQIKPDSLSHYELLFVIRKLWISKETENDEIGDADRRKQRQFLPGVKGIFEFYAHKGTEFIPLYRFDTSISDHRKITSIGSKLVEQILTLSMNELMNTKIDNKILSGRKIDWKEVDHYSSFLKNFPPLYLSEYVPGVYLTFEEFKNNKPSIKEYQVIKKENTEILYVKDENGNDYLIRKIWGFSDGRNVYIKSADMYFRLEKFNHNFYTFAAKKISTTLAFRPGDILGTLALGMIVGQSAWGTSSKKYNSKFFLKRYQLDLATGELN